MAASTVVKNFGDGTISVKDGTGTPVVLTVDFDQGDLSLTGLSATQREVAAYESRGVLKSLRHTTRTYPTGSFTLMLTDVSDDEDTTLIDFLLKRGSYDGNVSTRGANSDVYTVDIVLTIEGTDLGDTADHVITMEDCYCTADVAEGDPNTVTVNFTVYGDVTMT